jgi:hypothetical protein
MTSQPGAGASAIAEDMNSAPAAHVARRNQTYFLNML